MGDFKPDIWRLQAQLNTKGLVDALSSSDLGIRRRAATALRALGATTVIPDLKAALERESDPETRAAILAALEGLQQEADRQRGEAENAGERRAISPEVARWLNQLSSGDVDQVAQAAKALGDLNDKLAVSPLIVLFNNPALDIKARLAVAEALIKLESAPVEVALLGALRSPDWKVRRNGAAILGKLQAAWAIEPLSSALHDENEIVRKTAAAALKFINTPEARDALKAAFASRTNPAPAVPNPAPGTREPSAPQSGLRARVQGDPPPPTPAEPDDTQKISWPRRQENDNMLAPTRPLNPNVLEEARARFEKLQEKIEQDMHNILDKEDDSKS